MNNISLLSTILYVSLQLISNVSSVKIGLVFDYAVDMGVFLYPLSFTIRDVVHREMGKEKTKQCIYYTALMNLLMVGYFYFISFFKADPSTPSSAAFDQCLSPVWRIVVFSLLAQLVSELIDTEIYHAFSLKFKEKYKWGRVLASNSVSVPVDNAIFCVGAFAGTYAWDIVGQIFLFNFVVKYAISVLSVPLIYVGVRRKR